MEKLFLFVFFSYVEINIWIFLAYSQNYVAFLLVGCSVLERSLRDMKLLYECFHFAYQNIFSVHLKYYEMLTHLKLANS